MKVKCWRCGKKIELDFNAEQSDYYYKKIYKTDHYYNKDRGKNKIPKNIWKRVYCDDCKSVSEKEVINDKEKHIYYKNKVTFERAVSTLEKQEIDFYKYEEAIKAVQEFAAENPGKFDSSDEMVAAIVLIQNRIETKIQYQIGRYRVDFYLPELKCIFEVDGEQHSNKKNLIHDSRRDVKLRETLGSDWEIVRIPTKYIETKAELLVVAIKRMREEKIKIREKNNGIIPSYYSERDDGYGYINEEKLYKFK